MRQAMRAVRHTHLWSFAAFFLRFLAMTSLSLPDFLSSRNRSASMSFCSSSFFRNGVTDSSLPAALARFFCCLRHCARSSCSRLRRSRCSAF